MDKDCCKDPSQCWEPCGELGKSAEHAHVYEAGYTSGFMDASVSIFEKLKNKCNPHPKAPHGFARSASHANGEYVCECQSWDPYEAGFKAGYDKACLEFEGIDE